MHAHLQGAEPRQVRLRLNEQRHLVIPSYLPPQVEPGNSDGPQNAILKPSSETAGQALHQLSLRRKPVVALIEVAVAGAEELALTVLEVMKSASYRGGAMSLDGQNRLGSRLGCGARSPVWCWKQASPDLVVTQGDYLVVPGPAEEGDLTSVDVDAVLQKLFDACDGIVVTLGARWQPRLFRPVLAKASHIWLIARAGLWSGVETRLEQAEFSGWTDVDRIRLVVLGQGGRMPEELGVTVAGVLPAAEGQAAREFAIHELEGG